MQDTNTILGLILLTGVSILIAILEVARMFFNVQAVKGNLVKELKAAREGKRQIWYTIIGYVVFSGIILYKGGAPLW